MLSHGGGYSTWCTRGICVLSHCCAGDASALARPEEEGCCAGDASELATAGGQPVVLLLLLLSVLLMRSSAPGCGAASLSFLVMVLVTAAPSAEVTAVLFIIGLWLGCCSGGSAAGACIGDEVGACMDEGVGACIGVAVGAGTGAAMRSKLAARWARHALRVSVRCKVDSDDCWFLCNLQMGMHCVEM